MTKRTLPLLLVATFLVAACASSTVAGGRPDSPISTSVPPGSGSPPAQKPKFVTPQPGLVDVTVTSWIKAISSDDGMTLAIWFWGSPCLDVDHADVNESPDRVAVTLYQGTPASMVGSACPEIAMLMAVRVGLRAPLDDRTVVDGSPAAGA